jgi:RecB family endonuclease NucS
MDKLMKEFQKFWRRNADVWEQKSDYSEAFPHLLLMAFLQRILNGGGRIEREYAAGRGRMDLAVEYNGKWFVIEIKLIHDYETPQTVEEEGLEQIKGYRDKIDAAAQSYLVIFDRRSKSLQLPWEERIYRRTVGDIIVLGC